MSDSSWFLSHLYMLERNVCHDLSYKRGVLLTGVVSWLELAGLESETSGEELSNMVQQDYPKDRVLIKSRKQNWTLLQNAVEPCIYSLLVTGEGCYADTSYPARETGSPPDSFRGTYVCHDDTENVGTSLRRDGLLGSQDKDTAARLTHTQEGQG